MNLRRMTLAAAAVLSFHGAASAHDYKAGSIEIDDLWVRATVPGQKMGGGYMEIENDGKAADQLLAVKSDASEKVEIHETRTANGVSTMRMVNEPLNVPADGELKFAPGGYHIMFVKLKEPFKEGDEIPATLSFKDAGDVAVKFKVKPLIYKAPGANAMHGDMAGHMSKDMGKMSH